MIDSGKKAILSPERIIAFSDGVIAIAITLLVLGLEIPENYNSMTFMEVIKECLQKFDTWLISFWIIGSFWIMHRKLFNRIMKVDTIILWLNMLFLLIITSLSWTVSLIEAYPEEPRAVAIFSISLGLAGISHFCIRLYANKKGFSESISSPGILSSLATPITAVLSILCAFIITPVAGLYFWMIRHLIFRIGKVIDRKMFKKTGN